MDELDDRELIDPEVPLAGLNKSPRRKKGLSRLYFSTFSFVLLVVVLVSVISLGTFGVKQNDFNKLKDTLHPSGHYCILFSSYAGYDEEHKRILVQLSTIGSCAFVLWGQISVLIVSVVWLVYFIVLAIIGARIISLMRILDFIVLLLTFLLSMSVSVTLNAGLSRTCAAWKVKSCYGAGFLPKLDNEKWVIKFYDALITSQNSSWTTTVMFLFLTVWTAILMVVFCRRITRRRRIAREVEDDELHEEYDNDDYGSAEK